MTMKIILIICAVIALLDLVVVGATMKISSRISRIEEAERVLKERESNEI